MTTLLLRLAAPLQSWGTSSRFVHRNTDRWPSRSGVIGLLAAATGLRRTDPLEELLSLRIGVRIEQPGRIERDFQTARTRDGQASMPLSYRFYLADAVFLAALHGDANLLAGLREALRRPVFPLFLGRRAFPPAGPIAVGLRDGDIEQALHDEPWQAADWVRRQHGERLVTLDTVADCAPDDQDGDLVRDDPVSFDPRRREYGWRSVRREQVVVTNPSWVESGSVAPSHDPFALLGGGG